MRNFSNLLLIILVLFAFTLKISAAPEPPHQQMKAAGATKSQSYLTQQKNPGAKTAQTPQEKKQQFEQDAMAAIPDVEVEYAKVVSWVNSDQIPDDANRNTLLKNISKIRKVSACL